MGQPTGQPSCQPTTRSTVVAAIKRQLLNTRTPLTSHLRPATSSGLKQPSSQPSNVRPLGSHPMQPSSTAIITAFRSALRHRYSHPAYGLQVQPLSTAIQLQPSCPDGRVKPSRYLQPSYGLPVSPLQYGHPVRPSVRPSVQPPGRPSVRPSSTAIPANCAHPQSDYCATIATPAVI
jgi:hypothetical protein